MFQTVPASYLHLMISFEPLTWVGGNKHNENWILIQMNLPELTAKLKPAAK
jgi:hypothetical protein